MQNNSTPVLLHVLPVHRAWKPLLAAGWSISQQLHGCWRGNESQVRGSTDTTSLEVPGSSHQWIKHLIFPPPSAPPLERPAERLGRRMLRGVRALPALTSTSKRIRMMWGQGKHAACLSDRMCLQPAIRRSDAKVTPLSFGWWDAVMQECRLHVRICPEKDAETGCEGGGKKTTVLAFD